MTVSSRPASSPATLDASRAFDVGLASPLTVAWGLEAREDTYASAAGDPSSYYKEGPQSFPGFSPLPAPATTAARIMRAMSTSLRRPIEQLQVDVAGRFEHFTDFGDTEIGKVTARYDFTPEFAIRGTISTGFRAPTLAEEFYTAVNVSPVAATVQLPADSAAAKLLGLQNLKPEISTQYSVGIVTHPLDDLSATVDVYSLTLGNRIVDLQHGDQRRRFDQHAAGHPGDHEPMASRLTRPRPSRASPRSSTASTPRPRASMSPSAICRISTTMARCAGPWRGNYNNTSVSSVAPCPGGAAGLQSQCQLLQPAVAVQLRAFRAAGKDRPDRGLVAG